MPLLMWIDMYISIGLKLRVVLSEASDAPWQKQKEPAIYACIVDFLLVLPLQKDPVVPAFPDLHLSPASMLKELSAYFQKFSAQSRLVSLPSPHELAPREAAEYPFHYMCSSFWLLIFWARLYDLKEFSYLPLVCNHSL